MAVDFMEVMGGVGMAMVSADINGEIRIWEKDEGTLLRVFESARKMKPPKTEVKKKKLNLDLLTKTAEVEEDD